MYLDRRKALSLNIMHQQFSRHRSKCRHKSLPSWSLFVGERRKIINKIDNIYHVRQVVRKGLADRLSSEGGREQAVEIAWGRAFQQRGKGHLACLRFRQEASVVRAECPERRVVREKVTEAIGTRAGGLKRLHSVLGHKDFDFV